MNNEALCAPRSIHHQRRWFYVLWSVMLAASLGVLALWLIPAKQGHGTFTANLTIRNLPKGTRMQVWAGPAGKWPGAAWTGERLQSDQVIDQERFSSGPVDIPIAYRRWVKDYIPRRTTDLVIIKATSPSGEVKFLQISLKDDLRSGLLIPKRRLAFTISANWPLLQRDAILQ